MRDRNTPKRPIRDGTAAIIDGGRRVAAAPFLVAGVSLMTLVTALPADLTVRTAVATHLTECAIAETLDPRLLTCAATLVTLENLADDKGSPMALHWVLGLHLVMLTFLLGGILDRLARQRGRGTGRFFTTCGMHMFRLCRLGLMGVAVYWALLANFPAWLFEDGVATDGVTLERSALFVRFGLSAMFALLVLGVGLLFDYAQIRTVVEGRRSMIGAIRAAARFIRRHLSTVLWISIANGLIFVTVLGVFTALAPGGAAPLWLVLVVGQVYVVMRLVVYGSHISYFQRQLAYPTYVVPPGPTWSGGTGSARTTTSDNPR